MTHSQTNFDRKRILYYANGRMPSPYENSLGPDLRVKTIVDFLTRSGHEVIISEDLSRYIGKNIPDFVTNDQRLNSHTITSKDVLLNKFKPDIVYFGAFTSHSESWTPPTPTVVECAGPMLLEQSAMFPKDFVQLQTRFQSEINALSKADAIVCMGDRQRYYYLLEVALAGFAVTEKDPIFVIGNSSPIFKNNRSNKSMNKSVRFVCSSGMYPWLDPTKFLEAAIDVIRASDRAELHIIGGKVFQTESENEKWNRLVKATTGMNNCTFHGQMSFEKWNLTMSDMDVSLEMNEINCERILAVPYRTSATLACGIPIIGGQHAEMTEMICRRNAGWSVSENSIESFKKLLKEIIDNPDILPEMQKNAAALAGEIADYTSESCDNFRRWLKSPTSRPGKGAHFFSKGTFWLSPPEVKFIKLLRARWLSPFRTIASRIFT